MAFKLIRLPRLLHWPHRRVDLTRVSGYKGTMKTAFILLASALSHTATDRVSHPRTWRGAVEVVDSRTFNRLYHRDTATIKNVRVKGHELHLRVCYPGGSRHHEFRLLAKREIFWRKHPWPPRHRPVVYLSHNANGETRTDPYEENLIFDLRPLRHRPGPIPLWLQCPSSRKTAGHELLFQ